ncbi:Calmodulin-binding domain [Quillaja saponaria]|nr:Calmodulin-binding domain [Quillaja saponaria]
MTFEITKPGGVNSRRNSIGKGNPVNSKEKIFPHYLRASAGSCHDFCKYGNKHAFELKDKQPIPKRGTRKPLNDQNLREIIRLPGTKMTSVLKLKGSLDSVSQMPNTSDPYKCKISTKPPGSEKQIESEVQEKRENALLENAKPSPQLKSCTSGTPKTIKLKFSSKLASSGAKDMKLSAKHATVSKPNPATVYPISSLDSSKGIKGQSNSDVKKGKGTATPKESVRKSQTPSRDISTSKPSLSRVASINARKHTSLQLVSPMKNQKKSRTVELKLLINKETNERNKSSQKVVSHLKNQGMTRKDEPKEHNNEEVPERTLYVIETESKNKTLGSDQNASHCVDLSLPRSPSSSEFQSSSKSQPFSYQEEDQEESEYNISQADGDSPSGDTDFGNVEDAETLEGEDKRNQRKNIGMNCSEGKVCQSLSLKFRRGKVVNTHSESNGLRKLKFKRGKILEVNLNVKADDQRRSFERTDEADGGAADTAPGPEKVVLRHQDVQGKKDAQGLFNNVIEETASKLVETRKSKVKALVCAFETVISLQERKTYANTVS